MYFFILRVFLHQFDYQQNNSEINHPQRRGPGVRDMVKTLFCYASAFVARDRIEPHGAVIEELYDSANVLVGRLYAIKSLSVPKVRNWVEHPPTLPIMPGSSLAWTIR